ncbi:hypothetical protein [Chitinophaga sp. HK235]|uniref:hypothetical protein n=1 Tax=Chitinophaga sp. HK235 TaxID=2952571 RepID=UPI001BA4D202|nr:hypothetical protein [Chitinophaga sp. HK235]
MRYSKIYHRFYAGIITCLLMGALPASAQLLPDQNPRYRESMNEYLVKEDSLTMQEGVTVQKTYKAYQYFEARQERREQRRQDRRERQRLYAASSWGWGYPSYSYGYGYPSYSYGYGYPGYRHHRYNYGCSSSFQWNDLATVTALAMGTYMLFR